MKNLSSQMSHVKLRLLQEKKKKVPTSVLVSSKTSVEKRNLIKVGKYTEGAWGKQEEFIVVAMRKHIKLHCTHFTSLEN